MKLIKLILYRYKSGEYRLNLYGKYVLFIIKDFGGKCPIIKTCGKSVKNGKEIVLYGEKNMYGGNV